MWELAEERGDGYVPPQLVDKPVLNSYCCEIWAAFLILSPSRNVTENGVGGISLQEIECFFRIYGVDEEDQQDFIFLLRVLDVEYIRLTREKIEQQLKASKQ